MILSSLVFPDVGIESVKFEFVELITRLIRVVHLHLASKILIENLLVGEAGWENDLAIAALMDLTNSQ